jgi:glycosyltransferase involved in cell wall biosynthesis
MGVHYGSDMNNAASLAERLVDLVTRELADFASSAAPDLRLPGSYAGHAIGSDTRADLLHVLGLLIEAGVDTIAGVDLRSAALNTLDELIPDEVEGFFSYRVAETVARLGGTAALSPERSRTALAATRSPRLTAELRRSPSVRRRNYKVVAARCLWALAELESRKPAADTPELRQALGEVAELFASSATGWVNDGLAPFAQYDIYTPDMYLLALPFADRLGPNWRTGFAKVIDDLDLLAQPGGTVVWGRSVGVLSLTMTLEVGAVCAELSLSPTSDRWLTRIQAAILELAGWFSAGIITAHQERTSDPYRSVARRLQLTLDVYGKVLLAARSLRGCPVGMTGGPAAVAWLPTDQLIRFDSRSRAAAWAYRSSSLSFVLPVMHGYSLDYLPTPRQPGLFEQPTSGPPTLIPTVYSSVMVDGQPCPIPLLPVCPAETVSHRSDGLVVTHRGWAPVGATRSHPNAIDGSRVASYRVHGRTLEVRERLSFATSPAGPVVVLAGDNAGQPVRLATESGNTASRSLVIDTAGIAEWRSHWGACSRVQQVEFPSTKTLEFTWRVTRGLRIASTDLQHQYSQALYGPMAGRAAVVSAGEPDADLTERLRNVDILHLAWPERWGGVDPATVARVIGQVRAAGVAIAWTQHNLVPHRRKDEDGYAAYALWAKVVDLVIHHSDYGQGVALATYTYGPRTKHVVIPHGAWTDQYVAHRSVTRTEIEREEGWPAVGLRLAVIGEPRKEKDIRAVLSAVEACTRRDVQLIARTPTGMNSADKRIIIEHGHLPERRYHRRMAAFDAVILPFIADGMVTTGTVFDCIGAAVPAIISDWGYLAEVLKGAGIRFGRTAADLTACLNSLTESALAKSRLAMVGLRDRYGWADIAERALAAFEEF